MIRNSRFATRLGARSARAAFEQLESRQLLAAAPLAEISLPTVDLNGDADGTGFVASFMPGGGAVPIVDSENLEVYDPTGELAFAVVVIAGYQTGDVVSVSTAGTSLIAAYDAGVLLVSGEAPLAEYRQVLRTLSFDTTAARAAVSSVAISVIVGDTEVESAPAIATVIILRASTATIVGRHIFYNNSKFDGNDPAANAADDAAIAPDKTPLLPGQAATFANYTSYLRGINGIMIDLAGEIGDLTASDFGFQVGNHDHPPLWPAAPQPLSITVRPGAGVDGSNRVTIVWADGAIKNQWLQVTVWGTANTGLASIETFYVGNLVGETGNEPDQARVNTTDVLRLVNQMLLDPDRQAPRAIDSALDFNRDGRLNMVDVLAVVNQVLRNAHPLHLFEDAPPWALLKLGGVLVFEPSAPVVVIPRGMPVPPLAAAFASWEPADELPELLPPPHADIHPLLLEPDKW